MGTVILNPKQVITRCVEEFEAKTQVELVLSIKKCSDSYFSFFWFYTLLFVQLFWITTLLWNEYFEYELLILESLFLIGLSYMVLMRFEVIQFFIPKRVKISHLQKASEREFYRLGMFNTKRRSGLLIVYSHWENQCVLIADKGVEEKITKSELEKYTQDFTQAFKEKDLSEAVGSMIRTFGVYWHSKWPNEDNENEIVHAFEDNPL